MKRRDFIQKTAISSAFLGLGGLSLSSFSSFNTKHLTILHTNDVHSYIDPFPENHPKNPNMGGVARRAGRSRAVVVGVVTSLCRAPHRTATVDDDHHDGSPDDHRAHHADHDSACGMTA